MAAAAHLTSNSNKRLHNNNRFKSHRLHNSSNNMLQQQPLQAILVPTRLLLPPLPQPSLLNIRTLLSHISSIII